MTMELKRCICTHPAEVLDLTATERIAFVYCANLHCGRATVGPNLEVAAIHWNLDREEMKPPVDGRRKVRA
jgi:ferredoxin-like protein FixX